MKTSPTNTKVIYALVRDFESMGHMYSDEIDTSEDKKAILKAAKKLGEDEIWHVIERRCVACSDRADRERNQRLGYDVDAPVEERA